MLCQHVLIEVTGMSLNDFVLFDTADLHDLLNQSLGQNVHLAVCSLDDSVALIGMHCDGQVAGQSPDGGGPDEEVELAQIQMGELALIVLHGELNVNGGAGVILILDLSLCKSSLVLGAPVHGLETLVDVAVAVHHTEDADFFCLEFLAHGAVGVLPVGDDAKTLEAFHLDADVLFGVGFTGGAEVRNAHCLVVELLLLDDGRLDRHTVVIPAGDVGGVVTAHCVGAGDKVLDGLVQGVTHVDVAVGEGRAVMQVEAGLALVLLEHFVVYIQLFPVLEHLGLTCGETCTHGEICLRKVDGRVEILCHVLYSCVICLSNKKSKGGVRRCARPA